MILRIDDLVFDAWGRRLFDHASANLPPGAKVGLVGRNGVGKSTLFRLILGEFSPGGGDIALPRNARIGAVEQEHPSTPVPLLQTVLEADVERTRLLADLETAPPELLADIYGRLDEIGADRAPSRAAEILHGLGFSEADLGRPMAEFSGGWRMRVAMAAALFAEPDLLLLDEPTNYLDLEGALWLQARLRKYPHSALIISHDRELLDHSVDWILHLHDGKLDLYRGGLSDFERQRAENLRLQASMQDKIQAQRAHMQAFVDRFRASATKARQAQSRLKMIARLQDVAPVTESDVAPFLLPSPEKALAPPLLRLEKAAVGYGGEPVLRDLNLRMDPDDRIGLLGVNGSGKSTFAKLLAGELSTCAGEMRLHRGTRVGWFHQHQIEALDPDDTPLMIMRRLLPDAAESHRRGRLASFGMTAAKVETRVEDLSGGERARLLLNMVALKKPHLLILDEPTNHLDIDSRRALCEALNDYQGAVLLIAHDRSLVEMVADRLWLVGEGTIRPFDGDMEDYARLVVGGARPAVRTPSTQAERRASVQSGPSLATLARKLAAAEASLARLSQEATRLEAMLGDPTLQADAGRLAEVAAQHAVVAGQMASAEAEWISLAERVEAAGAEA
jgi:ATP-binding cassette subfamily F protein 3